MRTKTFIFSALVAIYSLLFMFVGLYVAFLSRNPALRRLFSDYLLEHHTMILWSGIAIFCFGLLIFCSCFFLFKNRYYMISMGGLDTALDEQVVYKYVKCYWHDILPHERVSSTVEILKNKIVVHADLPYVPYEEQEDLLRDIERGLRKVFAANLGYFQDFSLSISFKGA
jgi:hypothetical protein